MTSTSDAEADARAGGHTLSDLLDHARDVQHDLNGALMVVTANADMIANAPGASEATKTQAARITAAAAKIETMTRTLLNRIRGKRST